MREGERLTQRLRRACSRPACVSPRHSAADWARGKGGLGQGGGSRGRPAARWRSTLTMCAPGEAGEAWAERERPGGEA